MTASHPRPYIFRAHVATNPICLTNVVVVIAGRVAVQRPALRLASWAPMVRYTML
ncbi:hypothetical protein K523DRAFT_320824 [Schizophyllum commune Tattone D]|nr:hypothetical protein K523DRAFT_320824 [Schizophyllum commune Tattone D]